MNKGLIIILCSFGMLLSCSNDTSYPYTNGLSLYLEEVHHFLPDAKDEVIYYITPLDGCDYCVEQNLLVLARNTNEAVIPILIDYSYNKDYLKIAQKVKENHKTYFEDLDSKIKNYQTGYINPVLIHFKNGKCLNYMEIQDGDISTAEKYLKSVE